MKENYQRALATMNEINTLELERFRLNSPVEYDELIKCYG